jgi:hypothetical protein
MLDAERKRRCRAFAESEIAGNNNYGNAALRDGCAHGDAQYPRHLLRLRDQLTGVAAILEEMVGTRLLKVAASDLMAWNLRSDRKDWHTIAVAIEQAIDEMKVAGTATARTDRKFSGKVGFSASSERRYLLVPRVQPFDLALAADHICESIQAVADDAVNSLYACIHQSLDEDVGYCLCHVSPPPVKPSMSFATVLAKRIVSQFQRLPHGLNWDDRAPSNGRHIGRDGGRLGPAPILLRVTLWVSTALKPPSRKSGTSASKTLTLLYFCMVGYPENGTWTYCSAIRALKGKLQYCR